MGKKLNIRPLMVDVASSLPEGAVLAGHTKSGLPIYKVRKLKTENKPRRDSNGDVEYAKHPTTGEGLYQKRKVDWEYVDAYVVPNQQGNGNLSWDDYTPPSPEEIAAADRARKIEELLPKLAGALIDNDLTAEALVATLKGDAPAAAATTPDFPPPPREPATPAGEAPQEPEQVDPETDEADPPPAEFPKALPGVARYELSNGETFRGSKADAIEAEAALKPPAH